MYSFTQPPSPCFFRRRFEEGIGFAKRAIAERPTRFAFETLAACYARAGRVGEAKQTLAARLELFPNAPRFTDSRHFLRVEDFESARDALQLAGFAGAETMSMK